jgi:DinB family protein
MNDQLPCLDLLEATPAIMRGLMSEISDDDARWKPAPDRFSIAEVLAHLSHSEDHCYRARVDRFLAEEMPEFEPDDAQMHMDLYKNGDPEEDFGHFEDQRETNIELLRGLSADTGSRKAKHRAAGEITLFGPVPLSRCAIATPAQLITFLHANSRSLLHAFVYNKRN